MLRFLCAARPLPQRHSGLGVWLRSTILSTPGAWNQTVNQTTTQWRPLFTHCSAILTPPRLCVQAERAIRRRKPQDRYQFHRRDKVAENFALVCHKDLYEFCKNSQVALFSVILLLIGSCTYHWYELRTKTFKRTEHASRYTDYSVQDMSENAMVMFICALFVPLAIVIYCSKRNLIRIYHDPAADQYLAIIRQWFRVRHVPFTATDVKPMYTIRELTKPGIEIDSLVKGNLSIRGHRYYTGESDYIMPEYYNKFMGYMDDRQPTTLRVGDDKLPLLRQRREAQEEKSFFYDRLKAQKDRRIQQRKKAE